MSYADPEKEREYQRRYRAANREAVRKRAREAARRRYAADPEKERERTRRWRAANREKARQLSRDQASRRRHGPDEAWLRAGLYAEQGGLCWLCGDPGDLDGMVIDHDHRCPACGPDHTCRDCRRGLAHDSCNTGVGYFGDDPERLRRAADSLEAWQREHQFPGQLTLFDPDPDQDEGLHVAPVDPERTPL